MHWLLWATYQIKNHKYVKVGHTSAFPFSIYWRTLKNLKNQNIEKMKQKKNKKIAEDIITLHMCTNNHNHIRHGYWVME